MLYTTKVPPYSLTLRKKITAIRTGPAINEDNIYVYQDVKRKIYSEDGCEEKQQPHQIAKDVDKEKRRYIIDTIKVAFKT